jgi:hypothetical protein
MPSPYTPRRLAVLGLVLLAMGERRLGVGVLGLSVMRVLGKWRRYGG